MDPCPDGEARYQARANLTVRNTQQAMWEVRCHPPTPEIGGLILAGLMVGENPDGTFPDPVVIPIRCCGG